MSGTSLLQLQTALYTALTADDAYMALTGGVYDAVPVGKACPYTVIGEAVETPDRTFAQNGHEVVALITTFIDDGSVQSGRASAAGFAAGLRIAQREIEVVTGLDPNVPPLSVAGHDLVSIEIESTETFREPDGRARRVETRYRVLLEDAA